MFVDISGFNIKKLGNFYSKSKTVFRVYAPEYDELYLNLGTHQFKMHRKDKCFEIALSGDLELYRYNYSNNKGVSFTDPFAYLCDDNFSYILDKNKFNKEVIQVDRPSIPAVVYECSVRDFSHNDSYPGKYKGKFLAFCETGLKEDDYYVLGVDYLKNLGITHVQLMPVFDFDNDHSDYNWGYNPVAYNYVKKDYVYDQSDAYAYINELRKSVNFLHSNGIRVILDVVFNHVYNVRKNNLGKMLKGRLYRYRNDGSLAEGTMCGNEVRSEDRFVRAYIVEMVQRYVELFDIDGIRMDLMGITDYQTVNLIHDTLRKIKSDFYISGEGWNMGDVLPEEERASINNAYKMPDVLMFNDRFRETIISYVSGNMNVNEDVKQVLMAENYLDFSHSLNYIECHDGFTMFDRMQNYMYDEDEWVRRRRCTLGLALVMVARGTPFIHAGQEFLRTKYGIENSYNRGDDINQFDWNLRVYNNTICDYFKDLIAIRKENPDFDDPDAETSVSNYYECLIYRVGSLIIFINPTENEHIYDDGETYLVLHDGETKLNQRRGVISISSYSLVICKL